MRPLKSATGTAGPDVEVIDRVRIDLQVSRHQDADERRVGLHVSGAVDLAKVRGHVGFMTGQAAAITATDTFMPGMRAGKSAP